ncbi:MAG: hypothetical protein PHS93_07810 [Candidatus Omnitrophica bacterium]|nr:hypothetical protein [Candidatus Omnitrophota bacterium]
MKKLNYALRDVPEALWIRAKHVAIDEGITFRQLILNAIEKYVEQKKKGKVKP